MGWPAWIATPAGAAWDFVTNVIPVERWVSMIGNVLKYFSMAFVLLTLLFFVVLARDWGLSATQRFVLAILILVLLFVALGIVLSLAIRSGDLLYNPLERSLRQGRNYGTKERPISKKEVVLQRLDSTPPPPTNPQIEGPRS